MAETERDHRSPQVDPLERKRIAGHVDDCGVLSGATFEDKISTWKSNVSEDSQRSSRYHLEHEVIRGHTAAPTCRLAKSGLLRMLRYGRPYLPAQKVRTLGRIPEQVTPVLATQGPDQSTTRAGLELQQSHSCGSVNSCLRLRWGTNVHGNEHDRPARSRILPSFRMFRPLAAVFNV